jgi:hypothetical protein
MRYRGASVRQRPLKPVQSGIGGSSSDYVNGIARLLRVVAYYPGPRLLLEVSVELICISDPFTITGLLEADTMNCYYAGERLAIANLLAFGSLLPEKCE